MADAIWDRVNLIPWTYRVPDDQQDPHLVDKLRAELPGILNWMIDGCLAWQRAGYKLPESDVIKTASEVYRRESDLLSDFIEERILLGMPEESDIRKSDLYKAYKEWAEENGIKKTMSNWSFSKNFGGHGIQEKVKRIEGKPTRVWLGIGWNKVDNGKMDE